MSVAHCDYLVEQPRIVTELLSPSCDPRWFLFISFRIKRAGSIRDILSSISLGLSMPRVAYKR